MADSDAEAGSPLIPCASLLPLTLEGVRECSRDPFWRRVRVALLLSLFVLWVALVATATAGAVHHYPCAPRPGAERVRRDALDGLLYRVEAGDLGDGALRGLISNLDYISELGVNIVCLSSIYKSPHKSFGYDVEDFKAVDPDFGTMDTFKELVSEMKKRGLRLVLDLVPNHTSNKHMWFQKSINRTDPYTDYYIWVAPSKYDAEGKPLPPNNWMSLTGGSVWEYNEQRKEFYLHQFSIEQPDLNFNNEHVFQEFMEIFNFWLDLGVNGFSLDAVLYLFEDSQLRDEPLTVAEGQLTGKNISYDSLNHIYTRNLPENLKILGALKDHLEDYSNKSDGLPRLLMTGFYDAENETEKYYKNSSKPLVDLVFNFLLVSHLNSSSSANDVMNAISLWLDKLPSGINANWMIGNNGQRRVADRFGSNMVDGMNMIALLLPGIAITYCGDEIGMEGTPMSKNTSRNAAQLLSSKNDPFVNAKSQEAAHSHLNVYKQLSKAREEPAIKYGHLEMKVLNGSVFAFTRHEPGFPMYLVAVNWSEENVLVDFGEFSYVSERATVYVHSTGSLRIDLDIKDIHAVHLDPKEGMVLIFQS
ncbi:maltase 1-like [Ischnura elegans]|uniref:maltase 1-like n=1 Tax=Ischnura elegans TaxID=197161 RepID=UPI001ED8AE16|nr:maltase 1-like [Ischnura elegans]